MDHTIAAISTATGDAGIGIVRLSGENAIKIGKTVFRPATKNLDPAGHNRKLLYGHIVDGDRVVDEVLISFMKAPHTYTKEDMVEVYTHGGIVSVRSVLALLLREGAEPAEPGEFTKRAFLNGRLDLSQAEAVIDVIHAKTERGYKASMDQLAGSVGTEISNLRADLLQMLSEVEYAINFTEDGQEEPDDAGILEKGRKVLTRLETLHASANKGKILREGIETVIVGKPNVGKSSLLNALIRENKAIVTDIPGTTRDVIEEYLDLGGVTLHIKDTAGIRETEDVVESIGVARSIELMERADLVIAVFDGSRPLEPEDRDILERLGTQTAIILLNKKDLGAGMALTKEDIPPSCILLESSMATGEGLQALEQAILELFFGGEIQSSSDVLITNVRHAQLVERAIDTLRGFLEDLEASVPLDAAEVDLRQAWVYLGSITGENVEDEVLNRIFSQFCVGK